MGHSNKLKFTETSVHVYVEDIIVMAKYGSKWYCPSKEFLKSSIRKLEENESSEIVRETLGHLPSYMVYEPSSVNPSGCYITEVMLATKYLGVKISAILSFCIPYPEGDTIILIKDCTNPGEIIGIRFEEEGFIVGIINSGDVIHIMIYKK
jgi:hypothetical protein